MSVLAESLSTSNRLVEAAAARARRLGRPVLASVTRPARQVDVLAAYAAANGTERALWLQPDSSVAFVGLGAAAVIGDMSIQDSTRAWRDLLAASVVDDPSSACGPLLMGGFRFDPAIGRLVLPRETLAQREGATWLTTNALIDGWGQTVAPARLSRLARSGTRGLDPDDWKSLVGRTAHLIRDARLGLRKVVLARAQQVRLPADFREPAALRWLARAYPTCTAFALSDGEATFLGATPERLVRLQHGVASTVALAGSAPRGRSDIDDQRLAKALLADPKEQIEHDLVVQAVLDGLRHAGGRPVAGAQPRVRRLLNVQHLLTEVRAQVPGGISVLDLVAHLHPTPAVGGLPRQVALDYIRAQEKLERGWYAGGVGWVDADGDGEFVVGIRSGLVHGRDATLFAGCGIVGDSEPEAEYAESGWKLRPMLAALGLAAD
jgi:isochorismate synthase